VLRLGPPAENAIQLCVDMQPMWPPCAQDPEDVRMPSNDLALARLKIGPWSFRTAWHCAFDLMFENAHANSLSSSARSG
jgi:hypothetical protein